MAAFQKEHGSYTGRGFTAGQFSAAFKTWIVKTPANGGPGWYIIDDQSGLGSNPYIVISDVAVPTVNGVQKIFKYIVPDTPTGSANIFIQYYLYWDSATHTGQGIWAGYGVNASTTTVAEYDFRGGPEILIIQAQYSDGFWAHCLIDEWVGVTNILEGPTTRGVLQGGVSAGSSVTLQLNTGEASTFTVGNYYYIFDFTGHTWVNYVKITSINTGSDQVVVDYIDKSFPSGSVISAYEHRLYSWGKIPVAQTNYNASSVGHNIPYVSNKPDQSNVFHNQTGQIYGYTYNAHLFMDGVINRCNPMDDGTYLAQRMFLRECYQHNSSTTTNMNRLYGYTKNLIFTDTAGMVVPDIGRIIDGTNYHYYYSGSSAGLANSSIAMLFRDTTSLA